MTQKVGVLAIQGGYQKHADMFKSLGVEVKLVKFNNDFDSIDRLVIPGGESTTLLNLLNKHQIFDKLYNFCSSKPVFGTCAGSIILSKGEGYLNLLDLEVQRNAYGRQVDSFVADISFNDKNITGVFIRAPKFIVVGNQVDILSKYQNSPVLLRQANILVSSFHPELTQDPTIHEYFLAM
ncbi:pyridoxal 5'-phosphate synthase glutaminase subunit PdxT [Francisella tularensis]|uniref:Pyridoxal 5'-phosphate synthase subunit PdxT n=7 Tax=Francisella tularensis TaxID=263 RepID=PDXT_FRATT|nr:pyridoxal 5'-phosphate synthase glutaminase subunit PdxT [Francisella tularensis]A4IZB4.1 RecName: Full=Pyridoxal 5'-phosphate synthase subunit PdxT; AltName: Full=Pdx2; AltName: Full=Pyridoxal 5'-phosphate synthase glutaminase subunit [Francisella tularensis subsp. tularensis WY96-3418]B2SDL4.1 RecName: Full=Pyridoxal 5'-phosphate synthase subunit PdxT; AltName: Full=Pdx2; AltName: Full=Pyridoxal 5'-phosphate synthase glutaminase subunit [Francisella tularensis subsp. mediasiatica FSC147]Q14